MDRFANSFDKTALTFKDGDKLHVSKQYENGLWVGGVTEGARRGRKGPVESIYLLGFTENLLENTDGGGSTPSVFSRDGSMLPSTYADARSPDDVTAIEGTSLSRW